jgi:ABC-2 type transport system permease protein
MISFIKTVFKFYKLNFWLELKSLIAYPATFWFAMTTIPLWSLIQITFIETIYGQVDSFLGYSKFENYVLFGTYKLVQSVAVIFFMVQLEELTERIRGNDNWSLDMMLLKPIDSQIFATMGRFWFGSLSSVGVGIALIFYGLFQEPHLLGIMNIASYIVMMCIAILLFYILYLFIQTWLFWVEYLQVGQEVWFTMQDLGQYPRKLYQGGVGALLNIVVPVTIAAAVPVDMLLGRMPFSYILLFGLIVFVLAILTRKFWQYSIKKYSSFSS